MNMVMHIHRIKAVILDVAMSQKSTSPGDGRLGQSTDDHLSQKILPLTVGDL
jgi:hypothetical protein